MPIYFNLVIALIIFSIFFLIGFAIKKMLSHLLGRSYYVIYSDQLALWISSLIGFLTAAIFIVEIFSNTRFENQSILISRVISTSLMLIIFLRFLAATEKIIHKKYDLSKPNNIAERRIRTIFSYLKKILQIIAIFITIAVILINFERVKELGITLLASAGLLTAILGFAAQRSLANILAGFQIAFTQSLRIDDVIFVEGEYGNVEEINLTYVVVKVWDKRRLVLPVTYFSEKPFQNWTRTSADLMGTVFLYVDYQVDLASLRQELESIMSQQELWDRKVAIIQVTETSINGIELRILISASSAPDLWDLRCIVREKMIAFLQREQIHVLPKYRIKQE